MVSVAGGSPDGWGGSAPPDRAPYRSGQEGGSWASPFFIVFGFHLFSFSLFGPNRTSGRLCPIATLRQDVEIATGICIGVHDGRRAQSTLSWACCFPTKTLLGDIVALDVLAMLCPMLSKEERGAFLSASRVKASLSLQRLLAGATLFPNADGEEIHTSAAKRSPRIPQPRAGPPLEQ